MIMRMSGARSIVGHVQVSVVRRHTGWASESLVEVWGILPDVIPSGALLPAALIRRIVVCLIVAAPAICLRIAGTGLTPVIELLAFGAAVVAAAFLLAWAAEAAQKDISGPLAIALLALIAV